MFNDYVFLDEEKVTKFYDSTIGYRVSETIKKTGKSSNAENNVQDTEMGSIRKSGEIESTLEEITEIHEITPEIKFERLNDLLVQKKLVTNVNELDEDKFYKLKRGNFIEITGTTNFPKTFNDLNSINEIKQTGIVEMAQSIKGIEIKGIDEVVSGLETLGWLDQIEDKETPLIFEVEDWEKVSFFCILNNFYIKSMSELKSEDVEFTILGKINKIIPEGKSVVIHSLIKSNSIIKQMKHDGKDVSSIATELQGPAVKIIPIAVYY